MPRTDNQVKAFNFLKEKFEIQGVFTQAEFKVATGFSDESFDIYLSKQFKGLLLRVGVDHFRVSGVFRLFRTWKQFKDKVVTQNRNWERKYTHLEFNHVIIFEFYLPLRNEEFLRETLDALFFKDAVTLRLKTISDEELTAHFPRNVPETEDRYFDRICNFISNKFGGYSIIHVHGRFRADTLKTRAEVFAGNAIAPDRYIVDETTAVVRFILPCGGASHVSPTTISAEHEANVIRWFFEKLFVASILEVVNAEDEIWLVEGGVRSRLHIWKATD